MNANEFWEADFIKLLIYIWMSMNEFSIHYTKFDSSHIIKDAWGDDA